MGLLKAIINAGKNVLADQWVDYIKCDALPTNVLCQKGEKYITSGSSNTKSGDNVISDGSRVDVADGQFMMIVENGKVVDFCAEPGQYTYNTGTQPSMLSGGFQGLAESFKQVGKRFTAGGQVLSQQYVYYINTKEIVGNKWGIGEVPFRDSEFNFTMKLSAYGEYSYKITDPLMFYANVCGNVEYQYTRDKIDSQLKAEVQSSIQPALGRIALKKIPYDQLPLFTNDICDELNQELVDDWGDKRGIAIQSFAVASVKPDAASAKKIEAFQESRVYTNAQMMGARLGTAQANAMETAAENTAGAMTGFMGMGFAQQAGGANAAQFFGMNNGQQPAPAAPLAAAPAASWVCSCGKADNTGKFCTECGSPKPADENGWTCECGTLNKGKFCSECGKKKPDGTPTYICDKCGWEPEDPKNPPKFCPQCGDRFDDNDKTNS